MLISYNYKQLNQFKQIKLHRHQRCSSQEPSHSSGQWGEWGDQAETAGWRLQVLQLPLVCLALPNSSAARGKTYRCWVPSCLAPWYAGWKHWKMYKKSHEQKNGKGRRSWMHVHRCWRRDQERTNPSREAHNIRHCCQEQCEPEGNWKIKATSPELLVHVCRWRILSGCSMARCHTSTATCFTDRYRPDHCHIISILSYCLILSSIVNRQLNLDWDQD